MDVGTSAPVVVRMSSGPAPDAAPRARGELRRLLTGTALEGRREDGELALSELVTNAVLHGLAPITVVLRLQGDVLRAEVGDRNLTGPSFSALDPTAVTGRGLLLISACADRWGVDPLPGGKTVWFELHAGSGDAVLPVDVDALLAAWGDDLVEDPALERVRVVLTDLDTSLVARSEAHVEALLRELALLSSAEGAPAGQLPTVGRVLRAASAMEAVRVSVRHQLSVAVAERRTCVDVTITLRREDAELVRDLSCALDEADRLSRAGLLLTAPAPVELSEARRAYLSRVLAQLQS